MGQASPIVWIEDDSYYFEFMFDRVRPPGRGPSGTTKALIAVELASLPMGLAVEPYTTGLLVYHVLVAPAFWFLIAATYLLRPRGFRMRLDRKAGTYYVEASQVILPRTERGRLKDVVDVCGGMLRTHGEHGTAEIPGLELVLCDGRHVRVAAWPIFPRAGATEAEAVAAYAQLADQFREWLGLCHHGADEDDAARTAVRKR